MIRTTARRVIVRRAGRTLLLTIGAVVLAPVVLLGALMIGLYAIQFICYLLP